MVVTPSTRPTSSAHHRCCHFLPATTTHSSPQSDPHHENLEPVNESHQMHVQLNNARVSQTNSTMITTTGKPRAGIRATRLNKICTDRPLGGHVPTSAWQVRTAGVHWVLVVDRQWRLWSSPEASALGSTHRLLDAGGAPHSSCPGWLIRYLVGAVCPSREDTGICHGGML